MLNQELKYHDFSLESYSVGNFGKEITFHLVFDYPNRPREESIIKFTDVVAYHFIHTGVAIITDIIETSISEISKQATDSLVEWARKYGGLLKFDGNVEICKRELDKEGYKTWTIWSAIGFEGLIIAKDLK